MSEKYLIVAQEEQVPPYESKAMAQGELLQLGLFLEVDAFLWQQARKPGQDLPAGGGSGLSHLGQQ